MRLGCSKAFSFLLFFLIPRKGKTETLGSDFSLLVLVLGS